MTTETKGVVCCGTKAEAAARAASPAVAVRRNGNWFGVVVGCKCILELDGTALRTNELDAVPFDSVRAAAADSARSKD